MYLLAYRKLGIFYENAVNRMLRDISIEIGPNAHGNTSSAKR